jgi:segregation and condensation protein A
MADQDYQVKLDIFEGPMDLLVHLIRKAEVDIYDIPIALITDQFLGYIEWMQAMNVDFAGDFLVMAASLMQIKSKMLLPIHEDEDEEDPRLEITRPLKEYLQIKSAAEELADREMLGEDIFERHPSKKDMEGDPESGMIQVGLFELIDAFQKILENIDVKKTFSMVADKISVRDRISQIVDILEEKGSLTFTELFEDAAERSDVIVTFLAVLEMAKLDLVQIMQHLQTGVIRLFYQ